MAEFGFGGCMNLHYQELSEHRKRCVSDFKSFHTILNKFVGFCKLFLTKIQKVTCLEFDTIFMDSLRSMNTLALQDMIYIMFVCFQIPNPPQTLIFIVRCPY